MHNLTRVVDVAGMMQTSFLDTLIPNATGKELDVCFNEKCHDVRRAFGGSTFSEPGSLLA